MTPDLCEPRDDGVCCSCGARRAVTRDGRFCKGCLARVVNGLTPDPGAFPGPSSDPPADPRDSVDDPGGDWWDGAARLLEGE